MPATHAWVGEQACPQAPQFSGSEAVRTQTPPHIPYPGWHATSFGFEHETAATESAAMKSWA
jgi:hypothetical protein